MSANVPLQVVEQRVVLCEGDVSDLTGPVGRRVGTGKGDDRESSGTLSARQPRYALGRRGIGGCLVGLERRTVVASVSKLELIDEVR